MNIHDTDKLTLASILVAIKGGDPILGAGKMPSGHVYARLMGVVGLVEYRHLLDILKSAHLITERNNLLSLTEEGATVAEEISEIVREQSANVVIN